MNDGPKPLLTLAIPVYNGEALLAPMLASLEAQDWSLFDVRFGDDGSTDGTRRVLDEFAARHPGRVFVESHGNMGPGPARNRLLGRARGEYVWFVDADDELAPGAIARIAEILRENPVDFLSFGYCAEPAEPGKARLDLAPVPVSPFELMQSMHCATWTKVAKTAMLRDGNVMSPSTKIGEDLVFSVLAACHAKSALFWYARPYWCAGATIPRPERSTRPSAPNSGAVWSSSRASFTRTPPSKMRSRCSCSISGTIS